MTLRVVVERQGDRLVPTGQLIVQPPPCAAHHACWINDGYWKLPCMLSAGHGGNHRGDLGGGLTKTWPDEQNWIDLSEHVVSKNGQKVVW